MKEMLLIKEEQRTAKFQSERDLAQSLKPNLHLKLISRKRTTGSKIQKVEVGLFGLMMGLALEGRMK